MQAIHQVFGSDQVYRAISEQLGSVTDWTNHSQTYMSLHSPNRHRSKNSGRKSGRYISAEAGTAALSRAGPSTRREQPAPPRRPCTGCVRRPDVRLQAGRVGAVAREGAALSGDVTGVSVTSRRDSGTGALPAGDGGPRAVPWEARGTRCRHAPVGSADVTLARCSAKCRCAVCRRRLARGC